MSPRPAIMLRRAHGIGRNSHILLDCLMRGQVGVSSVGTFSGLSTLCRSVKVGNYVWVASTPGPTNNIFAIDVSNPSNPTIVAGSTISTTESYFQPVAATPSGKLVVYISDYNYGYAHFRLYDVSNPSAPSLVTTIDYTGTNQGAGTAYMELCSAVVDGNYLYVIMRFLSSSQDRPRLIVIDVSNASTITNVSVTQDNVNVGFTPMTSSVKIGSYIYVFMSEALLAVWNVSNPAAPTVSAKTTGTGAFGYLVGMDANTLACFRTSSNRLDIFDVGTTPGTPVWVSTTLTRSLQTVAAFFLTPEHALSAGNRIIDMRNKAAPVIEAERPGHIPVYYGSSLSYPFLYTTSGSTFYVDEIVAATTVLAADDFSEADNTVIVGKSADVGGVWAVDDIGASTFKVMVGNARRTAYTAGGGYVSLNPGVAVGHRVTAKIGVRFDGWGIASRLTNKDNMYILRSASATQIDLVRKNGGVTTVLASYSVNNAAGDWLALQIEASGVDLTLKSYKNGTVVGTFTDLAANIPPAGTKVAMWSDTASGSNPEWDYFQVQPAS